MYMKQGNERIKNKNISTILVKLKYEISFQWNETLDIFTVSFRLSTF